MGFCVSCDTKNGHVPHWYTQYRQDSKFGVPLDDDQKEAGSDGGRGLSGANTDLRYNYDRFVAEVFALHCFT